VVRSKVLERQDRVVRAFVKAKEKYDVAENVLNGHFMPLANVAFSKKDKEALRVLLQQCPVSVTRVFMMDLFRMVE